MKRRSARSPHINYKHLRDHIQKYRKANGYTQEQFAELMDESVSNYSKLERGDRPMSLSFLSEVCVKLHVPLEKLLEGCLIHEDWPDISSIPDDTVDIGKKFQALFHGQTTATVQLAFAVCKSIVDEMNRR